MVGTSVTKNVGILEAMVQLKHMLKSTGQLKFWTHSWFLGTILLLVMLLWIYKDWSESSKIVFIASYEADLQSKSNLAM